MRRVATHNSRYLAQLWILPMAVFFAGHAKALDSAIADDGAGRNPKSEILLDPTVSSATTQQLASGSKNKKQEPSAVSVQISGNYGSSTKTKTFGKLSLSLSLTISVPVGETMQPVSSVNQNDTIQENLAPNPRTISELNSEIAAIEEMMRARQQQLDAFPANLAPKAPELPTLTTFQDTVYVEPEKGGVTVDVSGVAGVVAGIDDGTSNPKNESVKPSIAAPAALLPVTEKNNLIELPGLDVLDWAIALVVFFLAASGFVWYRRSRAMQIRMRDKYQDAGEVHNESVSTPSVDIAVASNSEVERPRSVPAQTEQQNQPQQDKQQSILPAEYEMLEEADIYLRFGHDKLAEETLREAIKINPRNPQAYLTLLRILFSREDSATFLDVAQKLKSLGDGAVWSRVAEMGRNLDSDNPLYR